MLNFAIRLISNAGYQGEITNARTACTQSDVFESVFRTLLLQFVAEDDFDSLMHMNVDQDQKRAKQKELDERADGDVDAEKKGGIDRLMMDSSRLMEWNESKNLKELCQLACHSEHTYLLTEG